MATSKNDTVLPETPMSGIGEVEATTEPTDAKTKQEKIRTTPRTDADVSALSVLYDGSALEEHYKDRSSKAALAWVKEVTLGLNEKFSAIRAETIEEEQLEAVYDLGMRVCELERLVKQRGLDEVFYLYQFGMSSNGFTKGESMFTNYSTITVDQVRKSVRYIKEYADEHLVWGMTLTFALLENSCEPELRAKINEELMGIPTMEQGGPTYFVLAIRAISSMSYAVSLSLTVKVNEMRIKDFEGEDVTKAISFLRGAIQRLKMCNQLPPNIIHQLLKIMQTSSNYRFNNFFATWYNSLEQNAVLYGTPIDKKVKPDDILTMAARQYLTMNEEGTWIVQKKRGSAFNNRSGRKKLEGNTAALPRTQQTDDTPSWRRPPGKGEPPKRTFRGKTEHWCTKYEKWCRHSTNEHDDNWGQASSPTTNDDQNDEKQEQANNVKWADDAAKKSSGTKSCLSILRRTGN